PTILYAPVTEALFRTGIRVRYGVNITGHGWRKLMRHRADFTYRIRRLPEVPPVLKFLQREAGLDARSAYGTFNMGAGFAVFVPPEDAERTVAVARKAGVESWVAGAVEAGPRRVVIDPLDVEFAGDELGVRL
ncbi:MAG: phosphoribosylformylglycinamidine cyclo-ligase, partial [Rhizobacter sp.]|nr:phosphoribosylformylglycinamidine cyclo-ligase [Rhizobacter sp.]